MTEEKPLSQDQIDRIAATLARIRGGLRRFNFTAPTEPAHIYKPEAINDPES